MAVSTVLIDTHRLVTDLKNEFGFSERQAEGVAEAVRRIDLENLVTKGDLREALQEVKIDILKWIVPIVVGQLAVFIAAVQWLR